jgi:hypothetical protein
MDMLVVISSEAPKKRKIYHKMGCIYAERIKFQNRLEIKVEQAEKEVNIAQDSEEMSELIKRKYYPGHTKKKWNLNLMIIQKHYI